MQGDPLTMILYGLGLLLAILSTQHHVLDLECHWRHDSLKLWYEDDCEIASPFSRTKW